MKTLKKILKWIGIILLLLVAVGATLYTIYLRPVMEHMKKTEIVQYDKDLTLIMGGGGNSGILVSDSLVLVIDTKMDDAAEELYKKVRQLAGNRPIVVVNTHFHSDHLGGNKHFKGATILAGENYGKESWIKETSEDNMPTRWLKDQMDIKMGDDTATIYNIAKATHTASDVVVYLHKRKMLFAGDVILNQQVPALMGVADPDGYMNAFEVLPKKFDIQKIVPGHGPMGGMEVLDNFRQYFIDMKTAANDPEKKDELVAKYKNWIQVPLIMSPGKTISIYKEKASAK
ncbi:MAG TPA: MBL fold metallo-hydrolase [Cytophagaceae bacterium]|jgi:glyoxylase-like metal-dependent hydrolase (beta-lactamase superfamily II)|nr:MBL fold metallo-hydrolase [Cytophagaceae bacterium]